MYRNKKSGLLGIIITIVVLILIVIFSNKEANTSFFEKLIFLAFRTVKPSISRFNS